MSEPNRLDEVVGGKYRIVRFLASGGMGSVYEAQHTLVRRRFAVKFLHHELAARRELLTRFQREAEAAGALESENVAAALDFGIAQDGAPYIVLEYLVGESLEHLLEREVHLPAPRATNIVAQACRGVQAAHAAGIVHRDLKPHNLFMCRREDGTDLVKVLDFGVAKLELAEHGAAATRTGTVLGTPSYMSPEQARGERHIDAASDVYALGAIAYELLSGKKPHPGDSHNAILHHIATQPALPLATVAPDIPAALVSVVERALALEASARYSSAEAFGQALGPWSRAQVWPAPKLEASAPRHSEPSSTLLAPAASLTPRRTRESGASVASVERREPAAPSGRPGAMLAVAGVALVGIVLVVALGRSRDAAEPAPSPTKTMPEAPAAAVQAPNEPTHPTAPVSEKPAEIVDLKGPIAPVEPRTKPAEVARRAPAPQTAAPERAARPVSRPATPAPPPAAAEKPARDEPARSGPVTFDQKNPYQ